MAATRRHTRFWTTKAFWWGLVAAFTVILAAIGVRPSSAVYGIAFAGLALVLWAAGNALYRKGS